MVLVCLKSVHFLTTNTQKMDFLYVLENFRIWHKLSAICDFSQLSHFSKLAIFTSFALDVIRFIKICLLRTPKMKFFGIFKFTIIDCNAFWSTWHKIEEHWSESYAFTHRIAETENLVKIQYIKFADFSKYPIFCPFLV